MRRRSWREHSFLENFRPRTNGLFPKFSGPTLLPGYFACSIKLDRRGSAISRIFLRCVQNDKKALNAHVLYSCIAEQCLYEHLLLRMGWIRLSNEPIVKIAPLSSFNREWTINKNTKLSKHLKE